MSTPIPVNHAEFSTDDLKKTLSGLIQIKGSNVNIRGVCTDTRQIKPGMMFVALKGERVDGHNLIEEAISRGASAVMVERDMVVTLSVTLFHVSSCIEALLDLGRFHISRWKEQTHGCVIAITGSAGKTTARTVIAGVLSAFFPEQVLATQGNLNNFIGLPMVALGLNPNHRFAVLELGTNHPGEIEVLARVAQPEIAVLTLISEAHSEGLGSIESIAQEKGSVFKVLGSEGVAIGNIDNAWVKKQLDVSQVRERIGYGRDAHADVRIVSVEPDGLTSSWVNLSIGNINGSLRIPWVGMAGAYAVGAAISVLQSIKHSFTLPDLQAAISSITPSDSSGRLYPLQLSNGVWVLDDSYNANPASMCLSIETAQSIAQKYKKRLILVLGEMRELGHESQRGHFKVAKTVVESMASIVVTVGEHTRIIYDMFQQAGRESYYCASSSEAARVTLPLVCSGDLVLVKGSRGIATEKVVRALVEQSTQLQAHS